MFFKIIVLKSFAIFTNKTPVFESLFSSFIKKRFQHGCLLLILRNLLEHHFLQNTSSACFRFNRDLFRFIRHSHHSKALAHPDTPSTRANLNVHKTFRSLPERLLNVLCMFSLRHVCRWWSRFQPAQYLIFSFHCLKIKFFIENFYIKCDHIRRKSYLVKKALTENLIFSVVFSVRWMIAMQ